MIVRTATLAAASIAALSAVGACTASAGSSNDQGVKAASVPQDVAPASASSAASVASAPSAAGTGTSAAKQAAFELSAAKIRTAELTVVIAHGTSLAARADAAETITLRAGGEVDGDDRSDGKDPSATIVLKVPPPRLGPVLGRLAQLGKERSRHLSTEDVTAKVADVSSRVISAGQAITRLRVLYAHAVKVADVIAIESELASRESDLESLQAQQRALSTQTSTATITLSLVSGAAPVAKKAAHHRTGFIGGLQNGWDGLTATVVAVGTGLGAALPFLAVLLAIAGAGRVVWTRTRSRRPDAPTPTPAPQD